MFAEERGVELEIESISLREKAHLTPELLAKNPFGQVPVLELPTGACIAESMAICRYLDETTPGPSLFGVDPVARALIHMWSRRVEAGIFVPAVDLGHHGHPYFRHTFEQVPEIARVCRATLEQTYARVDAALAETEYIGGDALSVADLVAVCGVELARLWRCAPGSALVHLERWYTAVSARPSAAFARYEQVADP